MSSTYNTMRDLQVIFFSHLIFANFRKHLHCYGSFLHATNFSSTTHGTCLDYHFKHPSLLEGENLCVVEAQIRLFSCWWTTLKSIMNHSMECYRTKLMASHLIYEKWMNHIEINGSQFEAIHFSFLRHDFFYHLLIFHIVVFQSWPKTQHLPST